MIGFSIVRKLLLNEDLVIAQRSKIEVGKALRALNFPSGSRSRMEKIFAGLSLWFTWPAESL